MLNIPVPGNVFSLELGVKVRNAEVLDKDTNFHEQDVWPIAVNRLKELGSAGNESGSNAE